MRIKIEEMSRNPRVITLILDGNNISEVRLSEPGAIRILVDEVPLPIEKIKRE